MSTSTVSKNLLRDLPKAALRGQASPGATRSAEGSTMWSGFAWRYAIAPKAHSVALCASVNPLTPVMFMPS